MQGPSILLMNPVIFYGICWLIQELNYNDIYSRFVQANADIFRSIMLKRNLWSKAGNIYVYIQQ